VSRNCLTLSRNSVDARVARHVVKLNQLLADRRLLLGPLPDEPLKAVSPLVGVIGRRSQPEIAIGQREEGAREDRCVL
jgi:hypothetical protein